jgi:glycosyltransferase involved in cell wall biosynthesis
MNKARLALVHDGLVVSGGAERLTAALCEVFPGAPLYTSAWLPDQTFPFFTTHPPRELPFAKLVDSERRFKRLFPLWWLGFRRLRFENVDLVLSSSSYLAKYIRPPQGVPHICYLHNAFRYIWDREVYEEESLPLSGTALRVTDALLPRLRRMDRRLTRQITHLVTNSQHMAGRIKEIYGREAEVVYPPVATSEYPFSRERQDFYLVAGRLLSYKKVDVAIQACQKLGRRLRVVGSGPEEARLRAMAQDGVEFLGRVPESQLKQLYSQARALLYPGYEDLGLIPLEAQATGCPVIAFGAGGVLETVLPDQTGIFFQEQNSAALEDAIVRFEKTRFEHALIRQHAQRFDIAVFKEKIVSIVNRYLPENKQLE